MADCTAPAKSGIPEALGLKTFTMAGTRWVVGVQAGEKLGYEDPGVLPGRLRNEAQFVRDRDWRVLRGQRCARLVKAAGLSGNIHQIAVLTEEALGRIVATRTGGDGEHARSLVAAGQRHDMAPAPAVDRLGLARHVFEGHDVPTITIAGQECWIASDVGRVLEYGRDGKVLPQTVVHTWGNEFREGEHYITAKGEILKDIKTLLNQIGEIDLVAPNASHAILLTRAGLWLVLDKTEKPVGQRFRRWLSGEVRQAAEEGRAVATGMNGETLPAAPAQQLAFDFTASEADNRRERRLLMQAEHRHQEASRKLDLEASKLDIEVGKLQVGFAEKVVGWDLTDPLKREVVRATAKAIGLDVAGAK